MTRSNQGHVALQGRSLPVKRLICAGAVLPLLLAGCSEPVTTATSPSTPQVSLSAEPTATPDAPADFDNVVPFVRAVFLGQYDKEGQYVADNSDAARYVAHQRAYYEVVSNNGDSSTTDESDIDTDGDAAKNEVTIDDRSTDPVTHVVWQDFQFEGGKVASWTVKGIRSLDKRLWHAKASDESKGVKASLVSAYEGSSGRLTVVVDLTSSDVDARIVGATYTPDGGYRHEDQSSLSNDVDKSGKTLTYFTFNKSSLGGKLKLNVDRIDSGDNSSSYSLTNLTIKVA